MYEALYRKWRPRVFSDVVGQQHITDILRNQVLSGKTSHAYLFCGSRGTGKTTCARILAKAVNCPSMKDGDPCGSCALCSGIDEDSILDVTEIDAASNNGVDFMRELKDGSIYAPTKCTTRVYIIDEVHMMTNSAFNAFLKLLEEPPPHVMFILATTDSHKLPPTIISRCQRYDFRRISVDDIKKRIAFIASQENIRLSESGAAFIAGMADGALRNAISMLEQSGMAAGDTEITEKNASAALGIAENDELFAVLDALSKNDGILTLNALEKLYSSGCSMQSFLERLLIAFRDIIMVLTSGGSVALLGSGYVADDLKHVSGEFSPARLMSLSRIVTEALQSVKSSVNPRVETELCLMRMCNVPAAQSAQPTPAATVQIEQLLSRINALETRLAALESSPSTISAAPARIHTSAPPSPLIGPAPCAPNASTAKPSLSAGNFSKIKFRPELEAKLKLTMGILEFTQLQICAIETEPDGKVMRIVCEKHFSYDVLNRADVLRRILDASFAVTGVTYEPLIYDANECRTAQTEFAENDGFNALLDLEKTHGDIVEID